MSIESEIKRLSKRKADFISKAYKRLGKEVSYIQEKLLEMIFDEYLGKFQVIEGKLALTERNMRLVSEIDEVFDDFAKTYQNAVIAGFGKDISELTIVTGDYFMGMGVADKTVRNIAKKMKWIDISLGIKDGEVIKGSYLDRLAYSQEVRQTLKNYVTSSVVQAKGYTDYMGGMRSLVVGGKGMNGAVQGYWRNYAWDTYYQVEAAKSEYFAEEVGFDYFIYSGIVIKTSRQFCINRAGMVFSKEDAETWKCDPDLLRRRGVDGCDESYNYATERGRWNCMHSLDWIDKETAESLGIVSMRF